MGNVPSTVFSALAAGVLATTGVAVISVDGDRSEVAGPAALSAPAVVHAQPVLAAAVLPNPSPNALGMYPGNAAGVAKLNTWTGTSLGNVCKYSDPALDAVINQIKTVSEASDEAVELWHEAADMIVPEALGGFVLFRSDLMIYNTTKLGDFKPLAGGGDFSLPDPFVTYVKSGS